MHRHRQGKSRNQGKTAFSIITKVASVAKNVLHVAIVNVAILHCTVGWVLISLSILVLVFYYLLLTAELKHIGDLKCR